MLAAVAWPLIACGGDWPMWRYDAQRSAASPDPLPARMRLLWSRRLPLLKPAWPDQAKLQFDVAYEPIVTGSRLVIGSPRDGSVTAYDARSGSEVWRFFADGPVRFAPLAWQDKLYFASDDGHLYCLRTADGSLVWRFRGGPSNRKVLGNEQLISTWPARGAPVLVDGKVYFAAGIWPFMGIFLHALDATTGEVLWTNDGDGSLYVKQPHNTDSFAGVAPQGPLVSIGSKLLVPGGRSVPACYDRETGRMLYYQLAENGKRGGGWSVSAVDRLFFNGGAAFDLESKSSLGSVGELVTFANGRLFDFRSGALRAHDLKTSEVTLSDTLDRKGQKTKSARWAIRELDKAETPALTALIKAGARLYAGSAARVQAVAVEESGRMKSAWEAPVEGTPASLVAADDKLFVSTREGGLFCFAEASKAPAGPLRHDFMPQPVPKDETWSPRAASILKATGVGEGYVLAWGVGTGGLVREVARHSALRVFVIEPDATKANAFRDELVRSGQTDRISVLVSGPGELSLPPYLASLIVTESLPEALHGDTAGALRRMFAALRPYGGVACLPVPPAERETLKTVFDELHLEGAVWKQDGDWTLVTRDGALPESANWTHEHADAANTRVSKDNRVKAPLGLLWFGGSSNEAILPRHGHGPQPQVVDGRLFIEGMDLLRAMDIYTGRVLWESPLPGVGALYDNTAHQPGANATGTNYIATPEGIYVAYRTACLKLDPVTGRKVAEFALPPERDSQAAPLWGYINVVDEYLIGGADPVYDPSLFKALTTSARDNDNYSSSQRLVVLDRQSGKALWTATARSGFRHNAICFGGGKMYCIDRLSGPQLSRLKRRGEEPPHAPRLRVYDLRTGQEVWSTGKDVFGTWLSYSTERDILVEAGRTASDTLSDEPKGMRAYRGADGDVLWENKSYSGPAMLHHATILMTGRACDLLTGKPRMREHPLSGEPVEWTWSRNYGCNTPMASENLMTFRSGAAGYFDLCTDGGTGNFGGFRSSCSNNLVVAGGVLTAPDYTRTCTCNYQNQTSVGLVHMPEVETWTFFGGQTPREPIRRLGVNLGAPGDRKAEDGTLWLEHPSVGGASPNVSITTVPEQPEWFRRHSSQVDGAGPAWVTASGAKGLTSLKVQLGTSDKQPRKYTVRLYFAEPDDLQAGDRVFQVEMQGQRVLSALDVFQKGGGRNRGVVKEFPGIKVGDALVIRFELDPKARIQAALLSGVEIQAEGW